MAESLSRGIEPMARRPFLFKMLGAVGGVFGLASSSPRSLGPRPGNDLLHTKWGQGIRAVTSTAPRCGPATSLVNGILTVFPEGNINDALSPTLLINLGDAAFEIPAEPGRLDPRRPGGVLQDLHPRRLPGQPVQRRRATSSLPLPPVDLRRAGRL